MPAIENSLHFPLQLRSSLLASLSLSLNLLLGDLQTGFKLLHPRFPLVVSDSGLLVNDGELLLRLQQLILEVDSASLRVLCACSESTNLHGVCLIAFASDDVRLQ